MKHGFLLFWLNSGSNERLGYLSHGVNNLLTSSLRQIVPCCKSSMGHCELVFEFHCINHDLRCRQSKLSIQIIDLSLRCLERTKGTHPFNNIPPKEFDMAMLLQQVSRLHQNIGDRIKFV